MPVSSAQFWRTAGLFNNQTFLTCNMNQPFFSDIIMRQCNTTTFSIFSFSLSLHLVLLVRLISPPRQLKIQILKLAFTIWFLFIRIFYGSIHIWLYTYTIDLSRDSEKNPGPKPRSCQNVSICHWNLTRLTVHSYVSIPNLSIHKFDVTFLLKIYLDSSVPLHNVNLKIQDYELVRSNHPSQHKRGGVCIYFRNSFPLKILNIYYLQQSISFELQVEPKICTFVSLY